MRKKIVKTTPMPNAPGTEIVHYADGSKGIRSSGSGISAGSEVSFPDQGREGKPDLWSGETMDGDPATTDDLEEIMSSMQKGIS